MTKDQVLLHLKRMRGNLRPDDYDVEGDAKVDKGYTERILGLEKIEHIDPNVEQFLQALDAAIQYIITGEDRTFEQ